MSRRVARARSGDDSGTALILALAFLALFGLVVGVILQFGAVGFRTTGSVRSLALNRAAANGALDGAVNLLSKSQQLGLDPYSTGCYTLPASALQPSAAVQCLARTGSGAGGTANLGTQPAQAVYGTSTTSSEGYVQAAGTSSLVTGSVIGDKTVSVGAGSTLGVTSGTVTSTATCSTPATGVSPACQVGPLPTNLGTGFNSLATNGDVALNTTPAVPATTVGLATVPTCAASKVMTLSPGIYRSAAALNALTTGGTCAGSLLWFKPGIYYMNFSDASDVWNLTDTFSDVVGGTLSFTLPASRSSTGPSTVPFPAGNGSTASGCDITQDGVMFIFGGDSRMNVSGSKVQLCAPPNTSNQRVAVWGPSAASSLSGTTVSQSLAPSGAWSGKCSGAGDATDPLTGTVRHSAKVASAGNACSLPFSPTGLANLLPPDATQIYLSISDDGSEQGSGYTQMTYAPPGGGAPITQTFSPNCTNGCGTEVAATWTTPAAFGPLALSDLNTVSLLLGVVNNNNQPITAWFDNPVLVVTFTEPLAKTSGAVASAGAGGYSPADASTAAIIRTSGSGRLALHGTIYAPLAAVDISETSVANDVVDRGVWARDVYLGTTLAGGYTGPVVSIPPVVQNARQVSLTASVGGVPLVRAEVKFTDSTGTVNGGVPHVLSWSGQ